MAVSSSLPGQRHGALRSHRLGDLAVSAVQAFIGRAADRLARLLLPRELREAGRRPAPPRLAELEPGGGHG